ncbi:MAG TPA: hypothetical protein PLZ12_09935 [Saprospiraceae bacterium]|nr:hypothetical protein [Saprospiraceae bacterium]
MKHNNQSAQVLRQRIQGESQRAALLLSEIKKLRAEVSATRQRLDGINAALNEHQRANNAMLYGSFVALN